MVWIRVCLSQHGVEQTVIGTAVMAQLSKGRWQKLSHFELFGQQLDIASILLLFKSQWTQLQRLKLIDSNLDVTVIAQLSTDGWPSLTDLDLTSSAILDAEAILHFATLHLPQLACLDMTRVSMCAARVQQLSQAPLLKLTSLSLG